MDLALPWSPPDLETNKKLPYNCCDDDCLPHLPAAARVPERKEQVGTGWYRKSLAKALEGSIRAL